MSNRSKLLPRRSFISRTGGGAAALAAVVAAGGTSATAQSAPQAAPWKPARHAEDDWFDKLPGSHRFFFDTLTPQGLAQTLLFTNNYYIANKNAYGLEPAQLAIVICVRHRATGFAFTDAIWAKYGGPLGERAEFVDPKTKEAPKINVLLASGYGNQLPNNGVLLDAVLKNGVQLAVCQMATRANATLIAQRTGGKVDEIYQELVSNLVPNSHMVPAGIVAVNRAQERGYAFSYGG
jgi:intracellular sulfur oxidation DsrE/DsrF family protein